jgi:hypothetical protein
MVVVLHNVFFCPGPWKSNHLGTADFQKNIKMLKRHLIVAICLLMMEDHCITGARKPPRKLIPWLSEAELAWLTSKSDIRVGSPTPLLCTSDRTVRSPGVTLPTPGHINPSSCLATTPTPGCIDTTSALTLERRLASERPHPTPSSEMHPALEGDWTGQMGEDGAETMVYIDWDQLVPQDYNKAELDLKIGDIPFMDALGLL